MLFLSMQRYRKDIAEESDEEFKDLPQDDDYVPYIPVRERKRDKLTKLGVKLNNTKSKGKEQESSDSEEENDSDDEDPQALARKSNISLLDQHTELKKIAEGT